MAIVIVVEDGSGKPDANSYVTDVEVSKYMTDRGITAPTGDALASQIILATDWLESVPNFKGSRTTEQQALQFPRTGVYVGGEVLPPDAIPQSLKRAHMQLVADAVKSGKPLQGGAKQPQLKMRKLGPLTQEWAVGSTAQMEPSDPHTVAWTALQPLVLGSGSQGMVIR